MACFGLLVVGRVVNIALPVAYKKVIDRLAETSAAAAAEAAAAANAGGNGAAALCAALLRAAKPTFRDVFLPWVAVYLTLAFLQVHRIAALPMLRSTSKCTLLGADILKRQMAANCLS